MREQPVNRSAISGKFRLYALAPVIIKQRRMTFSAQPQVCCLRITQRTFTRDMVGIAFIQPRRITPVGQAPEIRAYQLVGPFMRDDAAQMSLAANRTSVEDAINRNIIAIENNSR